MERRNAFLGKNCTLSPEEVQRAEFDPVLSRDLSDWEIQSDGTATLRVAPWNPKSRKTMELYIDGLRENMFPTYDVTPIDEVEIVERVWPH